MDSPHSKAAAHSVACRRLVLQAVATGQRVAFQGGYVERCTAGRVKIRDYRTGCTIVPTAAAWRYVYHATRVNVAALVEALENAADGVDQLSGVVAGLQSRGITIVSGGHVDLDVFIENTSMAGDVAMSIDNRYRILTPSERPEWWNEYRG